MLFAGKSLAVEISSAAQRCVNLPTDDQRASDGASASRVAAARPYATTRTRATSSVALKAPQSTQREPQRNRPPHSDIPEGNGFHRPVWAPSVPTLGLRSKKHLRSRASPTPVTTLDLARGRDRGWGTIQWTSMVGRSWSASRGPDPLLARSLPRACKGRSVQPWSQALVSVHGGPSARWRKRSEAWLPKANSTYYFETTSDLRSESESEFL